jgi:hypothetical protein
MVIERCVDTLPIITGEKGDSHPFLC